MAADEFVRVVEDGADEIDPVLVAALATGRSHSEIAKLIDRSERTVRRRASEPEVREAVAEYRRDVAAQAAGRLTAMLDDAISAMRAGLDGTTSESLRAADMIVRNALGVTREVEHQSRRAALAAEIARLVSEYHSGDGEQRAEGGSA
jgi:hypothetical protein